MTSNRSGSTAVRAPASRSSRGTPVIRSETAYAHPSVSPRAVTAGTGSVPATVAPTASSLAKSPPWRLTRSTIARPETVTAYAVDQAPAANASGGSATPSTVRATWAATRSAVSEMLVSGQNRVEPPFVPGQEVGVVGEGGAG